MGSRTGKAPPAPAPERPTLAEQAREAADRLLVADPELESPANEPLRRVMGERYARSLELCRVG